MCYTENATEAWCPHGRHKIRLAQENENVNHELLQTHDPTNDASTVTFFRSTKNCNVCGCASRTAAMYVWETAMAGWLHGIVVNV